MKQYDENIKNLLVTARWNRETASRGSLVRMEWEVKNCSDNTIIIDGYRIRFYTPEELRGTDPIIHEMDDQSEVNQNYISNPHVITILWPKESRSYFWAHVSTDRYSLKTPGQWGYRVVFKYHEDNSLIMKYAPSNIARIRIEKGSSPIRGKSFIDLYEKYLSELTLMMPNPNISYDVRLSHIGIIDVLIENQDSIIIVELKFDKFNNITINQMRQYLIWASKQYPEKEIIGLILVDHEDIYYIVESEIKLPKMCSLYVGLIIENRLQFEKIEVQNEQTNL